MDTSHLLNEPAGVEKSYDILHDAAGLISLRHHQAILLHGDDRKGWLQGQVTNDLRPLQIGGSLPFCLCAPTGQLIAICTVWSLPEAFVVITDGASTPAFLDRCEKLVILEDVRAELADFTLLSLQGPRSTRGLSQLLELPPLDAGLAHLEDEPVWLLRSNRTLYGGWDLGLPKGSTKALKALQEAFPLVAEEAVDISRLEAGIPSFGIDTDAKTLPPELGRAFDLLTTSYSKGCYTGQEVLQRLHSRGHTNRTWMGVVTDVPVQRGDVVEHSSRADAGEITSAAESPSYGFIAAAMVRREAAFAGEVVQIKTAGGRVPGELVEMPIARLG